VRSGISHSFLTSHVQVFEGDSDKLPLFAIRNKWSFGGPKMIASFTNFDDKAIELQLRGKLLSSNGKIVLGDQPVARFESGISEPTAGQAGKSETVSKMIIAPLGTYTPRQRAPVLLFLTFGVAPVDIAMAVTLFVCMQDISTED